MSHLAELRHAIGSPLAVARKLKNALVTLVTLLNPIVRRRRFARLQAAGLVGEQPTFWQLVIGAKHMLFRYLLPSNVEFYEHYEQSHWWQQILRTLDEPSAMIDPIGLGASRDMIVSHLVQVVHTSAAYDVVLLMMFEDGVPELRAQLRQLVAGTHPRQESLEAILEQPAYPAALLEALDRFEADPETHWRVSTTSAPDGCGELFDWGIETFGTPARLFAYCRSLPASPWGSLGAWWRRERVGSFPGRAQTALAA